MSRASTTESITKRPVDSSRIRTRPRQFVCVDRSLVYQDHICSMNLPEIALYLFLECVSDQQGLSYYSDKRICHYLHLNPDQLRLARNGLINKQIILYASPIYQVLDISSAANVPPNFSRSMPRPSGKSSSEDPVPISTTIKSIIKEFSHADK